MSQLIPIVLVFIFAVLLNISTCSCVCISIKRGKKLESLGTMDNFFYMRFIRVLLILSSIFLFIENVGFLLHYSYHNDAENDNYNEIINTINFYIIENKSIHLSDMIIYFGFISFLLCSVGAYYVALHRFLFTNKQTNSSHDNTQTNLFIICLVCYLIISLSCITFSILNLFVTLPSQNNVLYYYLLICFDIQLILSGIPVFSSLSQVIAISRDSAKSVRWSVTSVSPSKLYYKMSVKAVRMGMENIILNILLLSDIAFDLYEIIKIKMKANNFQDDDPIPCNFQAAHLIILYFLQLFIMLFTIDYTWVNIKYITVKQIARVTQHVTAQRYAHTRNNFSDFDYNNTVLKHIHHDSHPENLSVPQEKNIIKLKAGSNSSPDKDETPKKVEDIDCNGNMAPTSSMDNLEFEFLTLNKTKVRSFSVSSTLQPKKQKLHKDILPSSTSLDDSNMDIIKIAARRNESKSGSNLFSLIPLAAKKMSRSFVESVIAADKIWDDHEQDAFSNETNGAKRYSRYNKSKSKKFSKKSRSNSMPSNRGNKKKTKSKRKSVSFKADLKAENKNTFICSEIPSSPVSVLETDHKLTFVANMTPIDEMVQQPVPNFSQKLTHGIPSESIVSSISMHNISNHSNVSNGLNLASPASPKIYSQRTDDKIYDDHGYNSSTGGNIKNTNNKRKLFAYNHKLLFSDRASDSVSRSCRTSGEFSQFSELSDVRVVVEEIQYKNKMEVKMSNKINPIEESKSQQKTPKKPMLDSSRVSNISVSHINEIYHSSNVSQSQTLMADMEQILNDIEIENDEEDDNNCNDLSQESQRQLMKNTSLQIDLEAMDEVLKSIEDEAKIYTQ